jgi:signal transduction histidine kinase
MSVASGAIISLQLLAQFPYPNAVIPYWNALVRTTMLCLISVLLSEIFKRRRIESGLRELTGQLEARVRERTAQLEAVNASLEKQVAERSAAAEDRARKLAESESHLQTLTRQITEISDREQRRIGEDLHDGLCQHLVSTALAARTLAARLADKSLSETEDASEIAELLSESVSQARTIARGLYLVQLESGGLKAALEELAVGVRSRHRIACQFVDRVAAPITDESLMTSLFRIGQEAVNNALKHGKATQLRITLETDEQQIVLSVEDDGVGFQPEPGASFGMGLDIMKYRARMIGAALDIAARDAGGTTVSCAMRRLEGPKVPEVAYD